MTVERHSMNTQTKREKFEAWANDWGAMNENHRFVAWDAWQAGRASLAQGDAAAPATPVPSEPVAWKITREEKVYGVDLREAFGEFYAGNQKTAYEYLSKGWTVTPLYVLGAICSYCNGEGCREEGDPEIGSAVMDCDQCNGVGLITPLAAPPSGTQGDAPAERRDAERHLSDVEAYSKWYASLPREAKYRMNEDGRGFRRDLTIPTFSAGRALGRAEHAAIAAKGEPK